MARLVMKFGGTSVADLEKIANVARHVKREVDAGHQVAVIVSAMAGQTNQLVAWTREAASKPDPREYDAVVSSGEQVTSGLLALTLQDMGLKARSWQGWQIPLGTDEVHGSARIRDIDGSLLGARMADGEVAVIAGFQGIAPDGRISTLGRGGSDTSAVAIAAAIDADLCDIYTDVDGVYTTDPRIVSKVRRLDRISYEEMLEMASLGAKVLQTRSVRMAMVNGVRLRVRSSFVDPEETLPVDINNLQDQGTLVCDEEYIMEQHVVSGIAYEKGEAKVTLVRVRDKPGVSAKIFSLLADANITVDVIVQNVSEDGRNTDVTFTVPEADLQRTLDVLEREREDIGYGELVSSSDMVKISVVGAGMRTHAGVAAQMFSALAANNINIQAITTSEIKISVLIDADFTELALRTLHTSYGLDQN
ncbi:MAG TPA: aspartate kinase, partial [Rhizobiales bacterium]|nr:aspartate kinase [Hyphomicrobiales bacterium]